MNVFCPTDVIFAEKAIESSHDKANKYIMYSDKKNILQLVALLIEHNIKKIVLCPGSRNSPIVHTIANHPFFSCYPVTDERSAASVSYTHLSQFCNLFLTFFITLARHNISMRKEKIRQSAVIIVKTHKRKYVVIHLKAKKPVLV